MSTTICTDDNQLSGSYYWVGNRKTIDIDQNAELDFSEDWADWLEKSGNDTIASAVLSYDTGVVEYAPVEWTTTMVIGWLKFLPNLVGETLKVTFRITTASTPPRKNDRSIYIKIVQK